MVRLVFVTTFVAALGTALMAGLFFAFSAFVMTALGRLAPPGGIAAMQSINTAILNPVFGAAFFGTAVACLGLAAAAFSDWSGPATVYLLAGSLLYLLGGFGVTVAFNVPLNNALAAVEPSGADGALVWSRYLTVWTSWNHVRTVCCLAATACFIMALR